MGKKKTSSEDSLFTELATLDEVVAWVPTGKDHDAGITPPWCELVLDMKRMDDGSLKPAFPMNNHMALRRHDGELIIDVLHRALHPQSGGSVKEMLWYMLDDVVDAIQKRVNKGKAPKPVDVGQALGLATAIAVLDNPFGYDVDAVRAEAMERYDARN